MIFFDRLSYCFQFAFLGLVDQVLMVLASNWLVRRHHYYVERINLLKLFSLSESSTSHAAKFFVQTEVILERNCRQRHAFLQHWYSFFGFNRLVQTLAITITLLEPTSVLVNDYHLAVVCHHIVFVAMKQRLRPQSLIHVVNAAHILWRV